MDLEIFDVASLEPAPGASKAQLPIRQIHSPLYQANHDSMKETDVLDLILGLLRKSKVDFGDVRLGTDYERILATSDTNLVASNLDISTGYGVRILKSGYWGFAASQDLSETGIISTVNRAMSLATITASISPKRSAQILDNFAHEPIHCQQFHYPIEICPITTSAQELAQPFIEAAEIALKNSYIKRVNGFVAAFAKRRFYANTEGSRILTTHSVVDAVQRFSAVTSHGCSYRTAISPGFAGGLENFFRSNFPGQAQELCEEALQKCAAKMPSSGRYDLILDPHNLALTMHESVGHPTELDRVLGYELGFAGGSFVRPDMLNNFAYGSPIVNFTANNTIAQGGASQGFDDEGVAAQKMPIIQDGILVGLSSCRETAHAIGLNRSNGCSRATRWSDVPIVRIPNLYLEPGKDKLSLEDLIADTKRGIFLKGRDSFSIDQMRYNFQFGADMAYQIENGKIVGPLKDVIYQSITPDFWKACDAICDASEWRMHGVYNCGKGQPIQGSKMMHGAAPARFLGINVGF